MRAIPTSRAYWELRAEQVLNRVFNPEAPIDVEICDTPEPPAAGTPAAPRPRTRSATATPAARRAAPRPQPSQPGLMVAGAGLLITATAALGLVILSLWQQGQQALRQERNLLLVERLRAMGPLAAAPVGLDPSTAAPRPQQLPGAPASATEAAAAADQAGVPPPPSEPWMEELASLPASSAPPAKVLRVPMNRRISSPAPASAAPPSTPARPGPASPAAPADLPQLVGVVQVPGRPGSAIFQVNGSSTSAAAGESIGGSGWRLQAASGDSAVIERDGIQRRISISSGL